MERKKELTVSVEGVDNTYTVEWPTVQQVIDIESFKISITKGKYTELIMLGTKWAERALNQADMCAYLSVMAPALLKDMKVDPRNLDLVDSTTGLMQVYVKQFVPWWNEYEKVLNEKENPTEDATE